jgi:hypothetical protein
MAALTDLSDLINRLTGGNNGTPETQFWFKTPRSAGAAATAPIAGRMASAWLYDGYPAAGATPTTGAIPDRATQGSLSFTAPGGAREKFLVSAGIVPSVSGVFVLYDRLFHIGGLSGTSTTDQSVQGSPASPALTRNTGGEGNIAWYEVYTQIGTTSATLTMTYTNQAGTAGRTATINIGATGFREVTRVQRIPLATGDSGIRAVEKVALSASTGTAGNFGITIARPLAWIPVGAAGSGGWRDYTTGLPGIPAIHPDACLALAYTTSGTTAPELWAAATFVEK